MYHMTVNSDDFSFDKIKLSKNTGVETYHNIQVSYDLREWDVRPISIVNEFVLIVAGWFVYKNKKNNISELHNDCIQFGYKCVINKIECGRFVIYVKDSFNELFFSDPFGLNPHYYLEGDGVVKISPFPSQLSQELNELNENILNKKGHLFGDLTAYKNVYLIESGYLYDFNGREKEQYFKHLDVDCLDLNQINKYISDKLSFWNENNKSIALSAGFDSRFLFTSTDIAFSYCWGPRNSKDRRVARLLSTKKPNCHHLEFRFRENKIERSHNEVCSYLLDGVVKNYRKQFLANYEFVDNSSIEQHIAIDGYLGDVLQRGVYANFSGKLGEAFKLIPKLYSLNISAEFILRKRYKVLNDNEFKLLLEDFNEKMINIDLSEIQKVTYYEFLFGRGARFVTTGSQVMNSLCKTVVSPFAFPIVFKSLILDMSSKTLRYQSLKSIWQYVDRDVSKITSEGMYSPDTSAVFIPYLNLLGRCLTNYVPKYYNYGKEKKYE